MSMLSGAALAREFSTNATTPAWPSSQYSRWPDVSNAPTATDSFAALSNHLVVLVVATNGAALPGWSTNGYAHTWQYTATPQWFSPVFSGGSFDEYAVSSPFWVPGFWPSNFFMVTNSFVSRFACHVSTATTAGWSGVVGESIFDTREETYTNRYEPVARDSLRLPIDHWRAYELQLAMERREAALGNVAPAGALAEASYPTLGQEYGLTTIGQDSGLSSQNVAKVKAWIKANAGNFADLAVSPVGRDAVAMYSATGLCAQAGAPTNCLDYTPAADLWGGGPGVGHTYTSRWTLATNSTALLVYDWGGQPHYITGAAGSTVTQLCTNAWILAGFTHNDYGFLHLPAILGLMTATVETVTAPADSLNHTSQYAAAQASWAAAKTAAEASTTEPGIGNLGQSDLAVKGAGALGQYTESDPPGSPLYDAFLHRSTYNLVAADVWTGFPKVVTFYGAGTNFSQDTGYPWHPNGHALGYGVLTNSGTVALGLGMGSATQAMGTTNTLPEWCEEPTAGDTVTGRGCEVWPAKSAAIILWDFNSN